MNYTGTKERNYIEELVADIKKIETTKVHSDNLKSLLKALEAGNYNAAPTELKQGGPGLTVVDIL